MSHNNMTGIEQRENSGEPDNTSGKEPVTSEQPSFDSSTDIIYQTTIKKLKYPFGNDDFFNHETEWNTLFSLISNCSEYFPTGESLIQQVTKFILNSQTEIPVKISGFPGTGISPFLSYLYRYLYRFFEKKESSVYPIYIDFRIYRYKIYKDGVTILEQAKNCLKNDIEEMKENLHKRNINEIILILDGIDNSKFQEPLESVIINIFDCFQSKKIIGIRNYSNIRTNEVTDDEGDYHSIKPNIVFSSIEIKDEKMQQLLDCYGELFDNGNFSKLVSDTLKISSFDFVDYFCLNLLRKRVNNPEFQDKDLSYFLRAYCNSHLRKDNEKTEKNVTFLDAAKLAFDYKIIKKEFTENELYNNPAWQLMCRHSRIQDYLVAEYIVHSFKEIANNTNPDDFNFTYPYTINSFCKLIINTDFNTQNKVFHGAKKILEGEKISGHANALYLMGRFQDNQTKEAAKKEIKKYIKVYSSLDIISLTNTEDNQKLLALRTAYISLEYLGDNEKSNEYLEKLLSNEIWCSINRGFYLIYYGDRDYEPKLGLLAQDDLKEFPITYQYLSTRIKDIVGSNKMDSNIEIFEREVYTLFSLIFHRHKNNSYSNKDDREEAQKLINNVLKSKRIINDNLKYFLEYLNSSLDRPQYSHFSLINNLLKLKFEQRKGWADRKFAIMESVASHVLGAFYIADLMLPEKNKYPNLYRDYDKSKITETLLYHDLAESEIGDNFPKDKNLRQEERKFYSKIASYSAFGYYNVQKIEKLWIEFESRNLEQNINAYIAFEIDRLDGYAQLLSHLRNKKNSISKEDYKEWLNWIGIVSTNYGREIKKWIEIEFEDVISRVTDKND